MIQFSHALRSVFSIVSLCLVVLLGGISTGFCQNKIVNIRNEPLEFPLYKKEGKEFRLFAVAELAGRGEVRQDNEGGIKSADFTRLQLAQDKDKWLKITKSTPAKGRLVLTLETGEVFTVYGIN
ncbi:MAG TPA: hypothetical protein VEI04_13315, partial [Syntrophobacteria bacterium]|nr:hypothetical protein [Syntrophobacteria bacterium]